MATPEEHVWERRNVDMKILDAFWKLVNVDDNIRLSAAETILSILKKRQEEFGGEDCCPDLNYCLERLLRGLASPRKAARQGFTVVLIEVLRYEQVSLDSYLKKIEKIIPLRANQDVAPAVVGRALAYGALIRCGRLKSDPEVLKATVTTLRNLCAHRPYVEQVCSALLLELFSQLEESQFKELVWPGMNQELTCGWTDCKPEQLFLLLAISRHYPNVLKKKAFLSTHWGNEDVIHPGCFEDLGVVLKMSTSAHPLVHSACEEVLRAVLERKLFKQFWNKVINGILLQCGQSEKVYLVFKLMKAALPQLRSEKQLSTVLSSTFQQFFIRAAFNKQNKLNGIALELAEFLATFVKECKKSRMQIQVLQTLILPPGSIYFDTRTNTKVLANIVQGLCEDAVHHYGDMMKNVFVETEKAEECEEEADQQRVFALHQLVSLIHHPAVENNTDWQQGIVEFILIYAFFHVQKACELPHCSVAPTSLSESLQSKCQELFYKAIEARFQSKKPTGVKTRLQVETEVLREVVDVITSLFSATDVVSSVVPQDQILETWNEMLEAVRKLKKQAKNNGTMDQGRAFELLFYFLGFQLLVDPQSSKEALQELQECYQRAFDSKALAEGKEINDEPMWSDVLVDLMLSLLLNANCVIRSCLSLVFTSLIPHITSRSLQQILDVVDPTASSQNDDTESLVKVSYDNVEEEDEEMETDDEEDDSDNTSTSSALEDDNDTSVDEDFRKKIKLALGEAVCKSDGNDDDESEVYLTDSEMVKLDESLAEAFRQHLGANPRANNKKEDGLLVFKIRCLDFIMAYLKDAPPLSGALQVMKPLLAAAKYGAKRQAQKALKLKIINILQLLLKHKKFNDVSNVTSTALIELLNYLMKEVKNVTQPELSTIIARLCAWLVSIGSKLSNKLDDEGDSALDVEQWYLPLYKQCLEDHFTKSNTNIPKYLFVSLLVTCPQTSIYFIRWLQKYILSENIRIFKQTEALELLSVALDSCRSSKSISVAEWSHISGDLLSKLSQVIVKKLNEEKPNWRFVSDLLQAVFRICSFSASVFKLHPLQNSHALIQTLMNLSRSKRKHLKFQSQHVIKKLVSMTKRDLVMPEEHVE